MSVCVYSFALFTKRTWEQCCLLVAVYSINHVQFFYDPMNCSPPGSTVHGISQTRILKWVAISYSKESARLKVQTHFFIGRQILYHRTNWEAWEQWYPYMNEHNYHLIHGFDT